MLRAVRVNLALEAEAIHIQLSPTQVGVACCFPVLQLGWIDLAFQPIKQHNSHSGGVC